MTEDAEQRYRLPRSVIPSRYGLVLEPDLVAGSFVGTEDIAVAVLEPVTEIVMNAVDLEIVGGSLTSGDGERVEIREKMAALAPHLELLATFDPFAAGRRDAIFEPSDAYYIPFHGFAGVRRPGPLIRIYELEPPATR